MTAFATLLTPMTRAPRSSWATRWQQANPAGRRDRVPGPPAHFTRGYLQGLVAALQDRAYDQVPFQFADAAKQPHERPGAHRGDHWT